MSKIFKWDLIDLLKNTPLIWAGMVFSFLALLLPTTGDSLINATLILLGPLVGFIVFCWILLIGVDQPIQWLRRSSFDLELSTPWPVWQKLLSKLIISLLLNIIAFIYLLQLFNLIGRFSGGEFRWIGLDQLRGIPMFVLLAFVIDCTVMFSYILAGSFSITRRKKWLSGGIYCLIFIGAITSAILSWMLAVGSVVLPSISTRDIITVNGSFQVLSSTVPLVVAMAVIAVEFAGGSLLLAHRYQKE
jgi:hypothetical protein